MAKHTKIHLGKNLMTVLGIVLVWRGIWHILDWVDDFFWNGDHTWTAVVGVAVGLLILYIPDKDLKEIEKV